MYQHHDDPRFLKVMIALSEASGQETTEMKEAIYAKGLEDIPIDQIENAAWHLIRTRTFASFPKVAEIREVIGGKVDDRSELEAAKVWEAISSVGSYKSVVFDDPVTQAVIEYGFGGWIKLCKETLVDQQKWFIKDFNRIYGAYSRQNIKLNGALIGQGGGPGDKPKLIGDPEKALLVMNSPVERVAFQITEVASAMPKLLEYSEEYDD